MLEPFHWYPEKKTAFLSNQFATERFENRDLLRKSRAMSANLFSWFLEVRFLFLPVSVSPVPVSIPPIPVPGSVSSVSVAIFIPLVTIFSVSVFVFGKSRSRIFTYTFVDTERGTGIPKWNDKAHKHIFFFCFRQGRYLKWYTKSAGTFLLGLLGLCPNLSNSAIFLSPFSSVSLHLFCLVAGKTKSVSICWSQCRLSSTLWSTAKRTMPMKTTQVRNYCCSPNHAKSHVPRHWDSLLCFEWG